MTAILALQTAGAAGVADTVPKLLLRNADKFGSLPAMREKDLGIWQTWTWAEVKDEIRAFSIGLKRLGLKRGDTVAIIGNNRPEWVCAELAAQAAGGASVGILVAIGWLATGLAYNEMDVSPAAPASLSFVRPVADTVDWIARATALGLPGFGAATVIGTLIGSLWSALAHGRFRLQGFANNDDMLRHLGGALAMGVGGVLALGCSIGQGITGLSTLSVQSIIAAASILTGAVMALRRLERQL